MSLDRDSYIGGSDAAALMGDNRYKTVLSVWERLSGKEQPEVSNQHIDRGNELEPFIEEWVRENRDPTVNSEKAFKKYDQAEDGSGQILLRDPQDPRLAGHPDGIGFAEPFVKGDTLWEFKAPSSRSVDRILKHGLPSRYKWQVQWYMHLAQKIGHIEKAMICVWDCDRWNNPITFSIKRNPKKGAELEERAKDLLFAVDVGQKPAASSFDAAELEFTDDTEFDELLREYRNVKEIQKKMKEHRKRLKSEIITRADGAEVVQTQHNLARIQYDWGPHDATRLSINER